jgi:hypothetical protein
MVLNPDDSAVPAAEVVEVKDRLLEKDGPDAPVVVTRDGSESAFLLIDVLRDISLSAE